jgi:hypothetical protein
VDRRIIAEWSPSPVPWHGICAHDPEHEPAFVIEFTVLAYRRATSARAVANWLPCRMACSSHGETCLPKALWNQREKVVAGVGFEPTTFRL